MIPKLLQVCITLLIVLGFAFSASAQKASNKHLQGKPNDRISAKAHSSDKKKTARSTKRRTASKKRKAKKKFDMAKFVVNQMKKLKEDDKEHGLQYYLKSRSRFMRFHKRKERDDSGRISSQLNMYRRNDKYAWRINRLSEYFVYKRIVDYWKQRTDNASKSTPYARAKFKMFSAYLVFVYDRIPEIDRKNILEPKKKR